MKHKYLLGSFDDDEILLNATKKMRLAGYQMHEIFTPFPIHGLDEAMGLQDTRLHTAGFVIGATGTMFAVSLLTFVTSIDWDVNVGGKPFFVLPSFVPVTFELTVLFASIGMVVVMYLRNGFSVFKAKEVVDVRATDDRFIMAFCRKKYNTQAEAVEISNLLKKYGAVEIRETVLENEIAPNLFKVDEDLAHLEHGHH